MEAVIFNRLQILINKTYYATKRYKVPATFALLYHEDPLTHDELGSFLRISDHFIQIDDNHYFLNFSHTNQEDAFKAAKNVLFGIDKHFNNQKSYIAIDTYDITKNPKIVYSRLEQILIETKKHSYTRIEDEDVLNELI